MQLKQLYVYIRRMLWLKGSGINCVYSTDYYKETPLAVCALVLIFLYLCIVKN